MMTPPSTLESQCCIPSPYMHRKKWLQVALRLPEVTLGTRKTPKTIALREPPVSTHSAECFVKMRPGQRALPSGSHQTENLPRPQADPAATCESL